jgi:hypothetical protein
MAERETFALLAEHVFFLCSFKVSLNLAVDELGKKIVLLYLGKYVI